MDEHFFEGFMQKCASEGLSLVEVDYLLKSANNPPRGGLFGRLGSVMSKARDVISQPAESSPAVQAARAGGQMASGQMTPSQALSGFSPEMAQKIQADPRWAQMQRTAPRSQPALDAREAQMQRQPQQLGVWKPEMDSGQQQVPDATTNPGYGNPWYRLGGDLRSFLRGR